MQTVGLVVNQESIKNIIPLPNYASRINCLRVKQNDNLSEGSSFIKKKIKVKGHTSLQSG